MANAKEINSLLEGVYGEGIEAGDYVQFKKGGPEYYVKEKVMKPRGGRKVKPYYVLMDIKGRFQEVPLESPVIKVKK